MKQDAQGDYNTSVRTVRQSEYAIVYLLHFLICPIQWIRPGDGELFSGVVYRGRTRE